MGTNTPKDLFPCCINQPESKFAGCAPAACIVTVTVTMTIRVTSKLRATLSRKINTNAAKADLLAL